MNYHKEDKSLKKWESPKLFSLNKKRTNSGNSPAYDEGLVYPPVDGGS